MLFLKAIPQECRTVNIIEFLKPYYKKEPYIHIKLAKYKTTKGGLEHEYTTESDYDYDYYEKRHVYKVKIIEETHYNPNKINYELLFNKSENFLFYSYRDVSGTCNLGNAILLDLTIISETYFADRISILDLNNEENKINDMLEQEDQGDNE